MSTSTRPLHRTRSLLLLAVLLAMACGDADDPEPDSGQATPRAGSPTAALTPTATSPPTATVTPVAMLIVSPTAGDDVAGFRFPPGTPWQGQGKAGISQQEAEQFTDHPVFWFGEQIGGLNLQAILRDTREPWIGFAYGACREYPCAPPIQVRSEPVCATRPEALLGGVLVDDLETVRGEAQMVRLPDDSVRLWTGQVGIKLSVDPSLVDQLVQELRAINAPVLPGDSLPAPDFSACSDAG